jgi:hypothetical protein
MAGGDSGLSPSREGCPAAASHPPMRIRLTEHIGEEPVTLKRGAEIIAAMCQAVREGVAGLAAGIKGTRVYGAIQVLVANPELPRQCKRSLPGVVSGSVN